jgi:hypothetical protein
MVCSRRPTSLKLHGWPTFTTTVPTRRLPDGEGSTDGLGVVGGGVVEGAIDGVADGDGVGTEELVGA